MGRKSLENQAIHALASLMAIGESRHLAKEKLRDEIGTDYSFSSTVPTIHSYSTRSAYQQTALEFTRWCGEVKGVHKYTKLASCEPLVKDYLQYRLDSGKSVSTLKKDRSALGKLFGKPVDFILPERKPEDITRSRGDKAMDKHFSEKKNADLVNIARSTGGRREDVEKLCVQHFREIGGRLYVNFLQSKGGRDRLSPVRPDMESIVRDILTKSKAEGRDLLFDSVHTKADIHAYRRKYAQELYKTISCDPAYRDELLRLYHPRRESVRSKHYTTRTRAINKTFLRDDLYVVSQALGHNRLEITTTHYLF